MQEIHMKTIREIIEILRTLQNKNTQQNQIYFYLIHCFALHLHLQITKIKNKPKKKMKNKKLRKEFFNFILFSK